MDNHNHQLYRSQSRSDQERGMVHPDQNVVYRGFTKCIREREELLLFFVS